MSPAVNRDPDEVLDEERAALHQLIERGEPVDWNDDDRSFLRLAEKVLQNDKDECSIPENQSGGGDKSDSSNDDDGDDDSEALEDWIPSDIDNDPRPREDRDTPFRGY